MQQIECSVCGVTFAITDRMYNRLVGCKNIFHCPNGHALHFEGESDTKKIDRLSKKIGCLQTECEMLNNALTNATEAYKVLKQSRAYYKGQTTRLRRVVDKLTARRKR